MGGEVGLWGNGDYGAESEIVGGKVRLWGTGVRLWGGKWDYGELE